jgi:geranylgeranyl reductase family protein
VSTRPTSTDVLVVGAGPAGSAAAAWAARGGADVVLTDAAVFPRDKTCGDGLTPRAIGELQRLGLEDWLRAHTVNQGLRAHGFGQTLLLPWPGGTLPEWGSAVARTELDDHLRTTAIKSGALAVDGARAVDVRREAGRVAAVVFQEAGGERYEIACRRLVVADGVRSPLGKMLGRRWHRETVYGVAGRSYIASELSDDPWISSHLELRGEGGEILSGYGWIFPLGTGEVNIGVGTLATSKRPANVAIKPLMSFYADERREDFKLSGELRAPTSALLPMGGAVSGVAGPNWALIGDAAACVNPLNGEGIDYGLESGRFVAEVMAEHSSAGADLSTVWPALLRHHYGESFSIARRLAGLVTVPRLLPALGPAGMRSDWLMTLALRWMGNLVTDEDRDRAARVWRWAGRRSLARDHRPPFV